MPVKKVFRIPTSPGAAADLLYEIRELRYKLQAQLDEYAEQETALKEHFIKTLPKSQASGITGKVARVQIDSKPVPVVKSWPKFYEYILKTKDFSLLQRRVGDGAIKERWAQKQVVPGVTRFNAPTVSITKK